jgi:ribosomal protein S12 methylthiotransferase accessory factor
VHRVRTPRPLAALAPLERRYSDRICTPAETVAALRPYFGRLGITRVARQTGLDAIGIPCFAAIRPNALSLATSAGKGIDDDAAIASAVMEAAEYAIAEAPSCRVLTASVAELERTDRRYHRLDRLAASPGMARADEVVGWVEATDLLANEPVLVPLAAVTIGTEPAGSHGTSRSTNGLASGNCREEAIFHSLCELIERDATTLWGLRPASQQAELDAAAFDDPVIDAMCRRIADAGMTLRLFDQTSDLGVPVIYATIFEDTGTDGYFDLAAGAGCHPVSSRAALRAITEAAQTRITNIAGARDDFSPDDYQRALPSDLQRLTRRAAPTTAPPRGLSPQTSLEALVQFCLSQLRRAGIGAILAADLGGEEFGIAVVKLLVPELEDRGPNEHWRPGPRAARAALLAA